MGRYLARRLLLSMISLLGLAVLCFLLLRLFPGGPFDEDQALPAAVVENLKTHYGLNLSLFDQLARFLSHLVKFDFGQSILYGGESVVSVIAKGMPQTFFIGSISLVVSVSFGFFLGLISFFSSTSRLSHFIQILFLSAPTLFLGPFLIYLFGFHWNLLPITLNHGWVSYILPVIVLSLRPSANMARLIMNAMTETLAEPWVRTAKAYGFSQQTIILKYALRASLIPFLSYMGPLVAGVLSGSLLVEMIFNIQGLGTLFVESLLNRDYSLVVGLTLLFGFVLITANFIFDLIMYKMDSRLEKL
ncbi:MAG: peptide ABC transporter permease [Oligoflexia bacterium]|nr:MAG: peptide ABC transporter permease [Oligoflexia bacterium]